MKKDVPTSITAVSVELIEKLGEVGIDAYIDGEILKDIPILGSIVSVFKLSQSVTDYLLLAKIKKFSENIADISQADRDAFNKRMNDKSNFSKTSRMILHYLNCYDSEQKAVILGYIFSQFISGTVKEKTLKKFASLVGQIQVDELRNFVLADGKFDWSSAHEYIAHGIAIFEVPKIETLADIGPKTNLDQTGMTYGVNPWGAEVIRVLKPFFVSDRDKGDL